MNRKIFAIFYFSVLLLFVSCASVRNELANNYWYKARSLEQQGRYLEAAEMFEKSAEMEKAGGKSRLKDLSAALGSAASLYIDVGKYDKALEHYKNTLAIERTLGREAEVGKHLNNIGQIYSEWGQFEKAIQYYKQSLTIAEKLGRTTSTAIMYNNIGQIYSDLGQHEKAIELLEKSLEINRTFGIKDQIAIQLNNIGQIYSDWGQYEKAIEYYRDALTINRKYGLEDGIAVALGNIGSIYYYLRQYDQALEHQKEALAINRARGMEARTAVNLSNIGTVYKSLGQYDRAIEHYEEAIELNETLRLTAQGDIRRDYLASQILTYQFLTSTYLKNNDTPNAFRTIEISRAKLLSERIAGSEAGVIIPTAEQVRAGLQNNEAVLVYANTDLYEMAQIVLTQSSSFGLEVSNEHFLASAKNSFEQPIQDMVNNQRGITLVENKKDSLDLREMGDHTSGSDDFKDVINFYRRLLSSPLDHADKGLRRVSLLHEDTETLSRLLYQLLIKPIENQLDGKDTLTIIPDGILGFIPFETLIDGEGKYLVEKFEIKYAQSIGVTKLIQARHYKDRKPMLAVGGAVYDDVSYDVDMIDSGTQLALLEKQVYFDFSSRSSVRNAYARLGAAAWGNLPGTLSEVKAIEKITMGAEIITGDDASEHYIKSLSQQGQLAQYEVIHFATHGLVVPAMPELSAIVLSQFSEERNGEDGYLRMGEISELDLEADFVNLSACETGLGKIYGGEGVVGLTQSFLIAGANSLSVSLWQVADESTSQFMIAMYSQVEEQEVTYSHAITDVKRQFVRGDFGEEYQKPYYWSPFVYYGK